MAFITLRRSRDTCGYYLVESYRDADGKSRKRTLCYLGREQDGTDTLAKAVVHWERVAATARRALKSATVENRRIQQDRMDKARQKIELLRHQIAQSTRIESARLERQRRQQAEEATRRRQLEEAEHWGAIERLQRVPSEDNARLAKRAFRALALRYHPDQGGRHEDFIRLKQAYDTAEARWRRLTG